MQRGRSQKEVPASNPIRFCGNRLAKFEYDLLGWEGCTEPIRHQLKKGHDVFAGWPQEVQDKSIDEDNEHSSEELASKGRFIEAKDLEEEDGDVSNDSHGTSGKDHESTSNDSDDVLEDQQYRHSRTESDGHMNGRFHKWTQLRRLDLSSSSSVGRVRTGKHSLRLQTSALTATSLRTMCLILNRSTTSSNFSKRIPTPRQTSSAPNQHCPPVGDHSKPAP